MANPNDNSYYSGNNLFYAESSAPTLRAAMQRELSGNEEDHALNLPDQSIEDCGQEKQQQDRDQGEQEQERHHAFRHPQQSSVLQLSRKRDNGSSEEVPAHARKRRVAAHTIRTAEDSRNGSDVDIAHSVVGVEDRRQKEREYARHNHIQQSQALIDAQDDHQKSLAFSTVKQYGRYQKHWEEAIYSSNDLFFCLFVFQEWCDRKRYGEACEVTLPRFLVYLRELVAETPFKHDSDRFYDVDPIRVNLREGYEGDLPSPETIDSYVKAVVDLYEKQKSERMHADQIHQSWPPLRNAQTRGIIKNYKLRYHRITENSDVFQTTVDKAYDLKMMRRLLKLCWTRSYKHQNGGLKTHKLIGARDRLALTWNHFMITHGQSALEARLSTLFPHTHQVRKGQKQHALGIVLAIGSGKTNQDHTIYSSVVRNKDVEICPVGALAFYLFERWMDTKDMPNEYFCGDEWKSLYLLFGRSQTEKFSSSGLYRSLRAVMDKANHKTTKVTHAGRRPGAQHAQSHGVALAEISQQGGWNRSRMVTHYLSNVPRAVPYALAGFTMQNEELWLPRNTIIPPTDLQRAIFPFIENLFPGNVDWEQWVENVMLDEDEFHRRPQDQVYEFPDKLIPAMRFMMVLAHLRKVILQDMAVLMTITTDPQCVYSQHHILSDAAIFKSPAFLEFCRNLQQSINTSTSPLTDSLAANAPTIEQNFRVVNSGLTTLTTHVQAELGSTLAAKLNETNMRLNAVIDHVQTIDCKVKTAVSSMLHDALKDATDAIRRAVIQDLQQQQQPQQQQPQQPQLQQQQQQEQEPEQVHRLPESFELYLDAPLAEQDQDQDQQQQQLNHMQHASEAPTGNDGVGDSRQNGGRDGEELGMLGMLEELEEREERKTLQDMADAIAATLPQIEPTSMIYEMENGTNINSIWEEWFGTGQYQMVVPSIWKMNQMYGKTWRKGWDQRLRKRYSNKKILIETILQRISLSDKSTPELRHKDGFSAVAVAIKEAGGLSRFLKNIDEFLLPK